MVKISMDMYKDGSLDKNTALLRNEPNKLDELLHPVFDGDAMSQGKVVAKGLPASPGAATGQIVFHADEAEEWAAKGKAREADAFRACGGLPRFLMLCFFWRQALPGSFGDWAGDWLLSTFTAWPSAQACGFSAG